MSTEQQTPETDAVINGIRERAKPYTVHIYVEMSDKMKSLECQRDAERLARQAAEKERDAAVSKIEELSTKVANEHRLYTLTFDNMTRYMDAEDDAKKKLRIALDEVERLTKERDDSVKQANDTYMVLGTRRDEVVDLHRRLRNIADIVTSNDDFSADDVMQIIQGPTLRATRDADHATIDAAATACAQDLGLTSAKGIIATHMRSLGGTQVDHGAAIEATMHEIFGLGKDLSQRDLKDILRALVTNSQQKGGDEPCAQIHGGDAAESTEHTPTTADLPGSASNADPTSGPEGAA